MHITSLPVAPGMEPTPGSAVATFGATRKSTGCYSGYDAGAGENPLGHRGPQGEPPATPPVVVADSEGRAGVRPVPGAVPFTVPDTRVPLRFREGRDRLVGRVEPHGEVHADGPVRQRVYTGPLGTAPHPHPTGPSNPPIPHPPPPHTS